VADGSKPLLISFYIVAATCINLQKEYIIFRNTKVKNIENSQITHVNKNYEL
jgi:hypothetical protein